MKAKWIAGKQQQMEGASTSEVLSSRQEWDTRKEDVTTHRGHWGTLSTLEDHREGPGQICLAEAGSKEI